MGSEDADASVLVPPRCRPEVLREAAGDTEVSQPNMFTFLKQRAPGGSNAAAGPADDKDVNGMSDDVETGRRFALSMCCALLVLLAVGVELASGQAANSPEDARYQPFFPLGWPQPIRVLWWLLVAAAAAAHRLLLDSRPGSRRWALAALAATPFGVFAGGIAVGTGWSTWH